MSTLQTTILKHPDSASNNIQVDANGDVGIRNSASSLIGAVTSAATLVVGDGASSEGITIYTGTSNAGELAFADGTIGSATQRGRILYSHGDNSMRISTNGAEALRIDSDGRLLCGATSHVYDGSQLEVAQTQTIQSNSSDAKHIKFVKRIQSSSTNTSLFDLVVPASEIFYYIEVTFIGSRATVGNVGTSRASKQHFTVTRDGTGSNVVIDSNINSLNYEFQSSSAGGTVNKQAMGGSLARSGTEADTEPQTISLSLNARSGSASTGRVVGIVDILAIGALGTIS